MRKKFMVKNVCVLLSLSLVVILGGCGKDGQERVKEFETTQATNTEISSELDKETESTSEQTIEKYNSSVPKKVIPCQVIDTSLGDFYPITDLVDSYTLDNRYYSDENKVIFDGEYELFPGRIDTIHVESIDDRITDGRTIIDINGVQKEIHADFIEEVGFVDIDENDDYKELVLYDEGPSADPTVHLYRFIDDEIISVGQYVGTYSYDLVLCDKKGKILSSFDYVEYTTPCVVSGYFEIGNTSKRISLDYNDVLNKTYKLNCEMSFGYCEGSDDEWGKKYPSLEELITLPEGEEIKLINYADGMTLLYVELSDGRKFFVTSKLAG